MYTHNHRKCDLKVHLIFVTKYRKSLLKGDVSEYVKHCFNDICDLNNWFIVAMETDVDHIHLLLGYDTTDSIANIVKALKQQSTYYLRRKFPWLKNHYWKKNIFWSSGYFACSIGEASQETIANYINSQG